MVDWEFSGLKMAVWKERNVEKILLMTLFQTNGHFERDGAEEVRWGAREGARGKKSFSTHSMNDNFPLPTEVSLRKMEVPRLLTSGE